MSQASRNRVVVITGASSGIGRAAALAFARRGHSVVLTARRAGALREAADACERLGAAALAVPADVTDAHAMEQVARAAGDAFGRIDVWINNAAVTQFGRFDETPPPLFERVVETNLFGCANGARAALRRFREQGHGVLINVASTVVWYPQPYTAAYVASKHAIRALSECLRMELVLDGLEDSVHVCSVMPPSVDTPLFQQGANLTGREPRPMPPVHAPEHVAEVLVSAAARPRREIPVGWITQAARLRSALMPQGLAERMGAHRVERDHFEDRPTPRHDGNLFRPMDRYARISGGWRGAGAGGRRRGGLTAIPLAGLALGLTAGMLARLR